jgi:hypothetical protein
MPLRTYIPALVFILERACRYITRYQTQINSHLTTDAQRTALGVVLTACQAFMALLVPEEIGD